MIGAPVRRASLASPLRFLSTTTSSCAFVWKMPATPSGTRPTQTPRCRAAVIERAETSTHPKSVR